MKETYLYIRPRATEKPVTIIEVLTPNNKRRGSDGRREYLAKREETLRSGTHLVEIDLLRGGERLPMAKELPPADYYVIVSRAERRPAADVWPIGLRHSLPVVPVPLGDRDPDATIDLQAVIDDRYDRALYGYLLDYSQDLVPPLPSDDAAWVREILSARLAPEG